MIHEERIKNLNEFKSADNHRGDYILYWMQASVRIHWNHALEYAIETANRMQKPLIAVFGLTSDFPGANSRHYRFLIEGLLPVKDELEDRGVILSIQFDEPPSAVLKYSDDASVVITDKGYLEIQKMWCDELKISVDCPLIQVESNVIVPVETASNKEEYSAGTFRPKITRKLKYFMKPLQPRTLKVNSLDIDVESDLNHEKTGFKR